MITARVLAVVMPSLGQIEAVRLLPDLLFAARRFAITTPPREAAFLGQLAHESGGLRYWEEIASGAAYEGRADLGNTRPGDGRRYKGRGPIQITGRSNYRAAGRALALDLENHPEQASQPDVGFLVSAWYWDSRQLNALADEDTEDAYRRITRKINGCYTGWQDRLTYWHRARQALAMAPA